MTASGAAKKLEAAVSGYFTTEEGRGRACQVDYVKRPEDLLARIAAGGGGQARPGKLLQELGCAVLVGSVGFRGASAILARHCSHRSWQRYKRTIRGLPEGGAGFSPLRQVDAALAQFKPLRMAAFSCS